MVPSTFDTLRTLIISKRFLGMRLALIEIKFGLLRIIQNFNFKAAKGFDTAEPVRNPMTMLHWSNKFEIIFEPV